jgi:IS5 family transposase
VAGILETVCPKVRRLSGRPPITLGKMLRVYILQLSFNLSAPAAEGALYDPV